MKTEEIKKEKTETPKESLRGLKLDAQDMADAGLHLGHRTSQVNPKMKPYIYGVRSGAHIIDLEKTVEKMGEALKFVQSLLMEGKVLLLVGTKVQAKDLVKEIAKECNLPYVSERWLGGTFTNFETIYKRIQSFKELENKKTSGELEKYTKKERAIFDKQLREFENKFGGIKPLAKLPDAVFVMDMLKDHLAVKEAKLKGIKIIGVIHTNADPTLTDYPIPANDDSVNSIKYILEKLKEAVLKVKPKTKS